MRRAVPTLSSVVATALLVAGCAGSGYEYVKSSSDKTYFKVPEKWTLYDEEAILDSTSADLTDEQRASRLDGTWSVGFDADPDPSVKHVAKVGRAYPSGVARVMTLSDAGTDGLSLRSLRNAFFEVDTALEDGTGDLVEYEDLVLDGGFRGSHIVFDLGVDGDRPVRVDQTVLVDQATRKLYALVISCSSTCYERHADQIRAITDSWTVRTQ